VWCCQHQFVLGQRPVNTKSNEITTIPEFLAFQDIENSSITLDAIGISELQRFKSYDKKQIVFSLSKVISQGCDQN
jgi:predicted transposase YbfD/YdcC